MLSALVVFYLLVYCPTHTHTLCALLSSSSCRSFRSIYIFCGFRSIYIYLADVLEAYASLGSTHSAACCRRRARHVAPAGLRRRGGGGGILLGPAVSAAGGATHYLLPAVSIFFSLNTSSTISVGTQLYVLRVHAKKPDSEIQIQIQIHILI